MNNVFYERVTTCSNGWWVKGKLYPVGAQLGDLFINDEEGYKLYLRVATKDPDFRTNFKKVAKQ